LSKCKITVEKITFNKDIAKKYSKEWLKPCNVFIEGQEFEIQDPWSMPNGFCSTAWSDLLKNIQTISLGGNFPSILKEGNSISCCTDGIRPVIFRIERL
jgi:uncharacterized repeat protein (TIGR04076 family)